MNAKCLNDGMSMPSCQTKHLRKTYTKGRYIMNNSSRGISAAVLKNVALLTMTLDHVTGVVFAAYLRTQGVHSLYSSDLYTLGRVIGRIAFVLYAFMIAEGAYKTRNKAKYAGRLLLLAVISIVPHSYAMAGKWFNPSDMNIFFLLFTGLITIYAYQWMKDNIDNKFLSILCRILLTAAASFVSIKLHFEYGMMGILLILTFYIFRDSFVKTAIFGVLVMSVGYMAHVILQTDVISWFANHSDNLIQSLINIDKIQIYGLLAFPLIYFYNGQKGRQLPKYFYYLFYPVHLGILAIIKMCI